MSSTSLTRRPYLKRDGGEFKAFAFFSSFVCSILFFFALFSVCGIQLISAYLKTCLVFFCQCIHFCFSFYLVNKKQICICQPSSFHNYTAVVCGRHTNFCQLQKSPEGAFLCKTHLSKIQCVQVCDVHKCFILYLKCLKEVKNETKKMLL